MPTTIGGAKNEDHRASGAGRFMSSG
jgi:hypothetical protein